MTMKTMDLRQKRERQRREEYKETILHAAEAVILRKGCSDLTMDDVAREAQFSKATLYKYFQNKAELIFAIMAHYFDEVRMKFEEILSSEADSADKLRAALRAVLEYQEEKENISRVMLMDKSMFRFMRIFVPEGRKTATSAEKNFLKLIKAKRLAVLKIGKKILNEGIASGEFRPFDTDQGVVFLDSLIQGYAHEKYWMERKISPKEAADFMHSFILHGIGYREIFGKGESR